MNILNVTIYILYLAGAPAGKNPDIGAFVDAAACMRSATRMNDDAVKDHPEYTGRELFNCKSMDLVSYTKSPPTLEWKQEGSK
jgi:hypothetical protein